MTLLHKHVLGVWAFYLLVVGCGTLVGNPEEEVSNSVSSDAVDDTPQAQALSFNIADAPIDDARSVFVTIAGVEIKQADAGWLEIPLVVDQEVDLLRYQDGASLKFAEIGPFPSGIYTKTRLILSSSAVPRIVLINGTEEELLIPGEQVSGIEIDTPFVAESGKSVDVTLDFDLRKSLRVVEGDRKTYILQPVLRLLKDGEFGHIEGFEEEGRIVCIFLEGTEPDRDDTCENALNSAIVKNGKYKLPHLPQGAYKIQVYDGKGKAISGKQSAANVTATKYKKSADEGKGRGKGKNEEKASTSRLPK